MDPNVVSGCDNLVDTARANRRPTPNGVTAYGLAWRSLAWALSLCAG
jgi:hypothetical protein